MCPSTAGSDRAVSERLARMHLEQSLVWSRRLNYAQGTVYALIALGQHALAHDDAAAKTARYTEALGARPYPSEHDRLDDWMQRARRRLGEHRYAEHWAIGRTRDWRDLVTELLAEPRSNVSPLKTASTTRFGGLTDREVEVAALVGRGMSTAAIAAELVISTGTAKVHVARILGKLDLHSRAQLAGWAVRNGLAPHSA